MNPASNPTVEAAPRPPPSRVRTSSDAAPPSAVSGADLETLLERRVTLLASLARMYADEARRLEIGCSDGRADRKAADAFEDRANETETELEVIENRLADAWAAGRRPCRSRRG